MRKNFAIVSVFILFAPLQGGVIYGADGDTTVIEILSLSLTVVCLIRDPLHTIDPAGTKSTMIPATSNKAGLHQK
jgi:hypothetical protein